tara:strand:+ start:700 stop:876 length:177 start_codon:yes stop_codon:yes gene_type:complete
MKKGTQTNGKGSKPRPYDVKRYDAGRKGIKWDSEKQRLDKCKGMCCNDSNERESHGLA